MAWKILERLRDWKPLTRNLVVALIKIATGATAGALPESELLVKCVGGAAEVTAEQIFEALDPRQQQAVNDQLLPLLEQHDGLLAELQRGITNQNIELGELTRLVGARLQQEPKLREEFNRLAAGLNGIAHSLHHIEEKLQALHTNMQQEFSGIHRRFDELSRKPSSPYWLSIHNEEDVLWLRQLYAESRNWPPEKRRALRPAQFATLLIEAKQPEQASDVCQDGVTLCPESGERARLLLQKMRADLEQNRFDDGLVALREAIGLYPLLRPFPADDFEVQSILGVGGAGTALLCRDRSENDWVVVKCLHADGLARKPEELFAEVPLLRQLAKVSGEVVAVRYGRFLESTTQRGPYVVMDHFEGQSLQNYLNRRGKGLSLADFLAVALPVARALHAAHGLKIVHRDVKPDNVLVRHTAMGWEVRLIDFGLAVKCEVARNSQVAPRKSLQGLAAAGTADYAAPEQMGKRNDPIGPGSDVYSFGRFCCYTLFLTTTPLYRHWRGLSETLRELIEVCLEDVPAQRHPNFEPILTTLTALRQETAPDSIVQPSIPVSVAQPLHPVAVPDQPHREQPVVAHSSGKPAHKSGSKSKIKDAQEKFWSTFPPFQEEASPSASGHCAKFSLRRGGKVGSCYLEAQIDVDDGQIKVAFIIDGDQEANIREWEHLKNQHENEIQEEAGPGVYWCYWGDPGKANQKRRTIRLKCNDYVDLYDPASWPIARQWLIENLGKFRSVFSRLVHF